MDVSGRYIRSLSQLYITVIIVETYNYALDFFASLSKWTWTCTFKMFYACLAKSHFLLGFEESIPHTWSCCYRLFTSNRFKAFSRLTVDLFSVWPHTIPNPAASDTSLVDRLMSQVFFFLFFLGMKLGWILLLENLDGAGFPHSENTVTTGVAGHKCNVTPTACINIIQSLSQGRKLHAVIHTSSQDTVSSHIILKCPLYAS